MPYFFFLYQSPLSLCKFFDAISSIIDDILSINPSGGTDRPCELCYNFSIPNDLNQMGTFPTWIPECDSHNIALLDLFTSSETNICSNVAFPSLGNSDHVVVLVSTDILSNSKQDVTASEFCEVSGWN